ncbi:MAG: hypothetical protein WCZ89_03050 [Phycisphaerae bacterium]
MKGIIFAVVLVSLVLGMLLCTLGCEPEGPAAAPPDPKAERLYAAQNIELKKQIEELEKSYERQLVEKEMLLEQCRNQNDELQLQLGEEASQIFENDLVKILMEESQRLTEENQELREQIEQLTNQPQSNEE